MPASCPPKRSVRSDADRKRSEKKRRTKINAQIPCWIGAKMTPVLQLTDTDFAFLAKNAAEWKKREIAKKIGTYSQDQVARKQTSSPSDHFRAPSNFFGKTG